MAQNDKAHLLHLYKHLHPEFFLHNKNLIYCPNGAYAELTGGVDKVTIFYG